MFRNSSLLKNHPDFKGLEIDTQYVPSSQVSGDFYDFYKLSSTKFAVSVADVSGKGVPCFAAYGTLPNQP
jgi:serine phosphatase RsbU (regulator of sigma subunit)